MTLSELKESRPDLVEKVLSEIPGWKVADVEDVELDISPILEGVLGVRNLPPYIATYLREHFKHIRLNGSTASTTGLNLGI
jgi:hypothetical protein